MLVGAASGSVGAQSLHRFQPPLGPYRGVGGAKRVGLIFSKI